MRSPLLTESEIRQKLADLSGWEYAGRSLCREFQFKTFVRAFAFMTACALEAEKLNHHPDWTNVYGTVRVRLNTHDAGGVTELDFALAKKMDRLATAS
jgi:4a-hydroxytetrahydrobiopterin dehydratase